MTVKPPATVRTPDPLLRGLLFGSLFSLGVWLPLLYMLIA